MHASVADLLDLLSIRGPMTSPELQRALGISQPTISRLIRAAGGHVLRLGRARATRYAATREVPGVGSRARLYAIDPAGRPHTIGELTALSGPLPFVITGGKERWLRGEEERGEFDGLPYYLHDLRPQGFLGRQLAELLAQQEAGYPGNPEGWSDDQLLRYLVRHGSDLPGHLIIGDEALNRFLAAHREPLRDRTEDYPARASRIMAGETFGSSAGGEHPKFLAYTADAGHVIVKFSPAGDSAEAVRWRDLLIAEHLALSVLGESGLPAADSALYELEGRVFLESRRFDRVGANGRQPAIALAAIDAEFVGEGTHWVRSAQGLHRAGLISDRTLEQVRMAHAYGLWIANNDMHLGNLAFQPRGDQFVLHPLYDMVPMRLAPRRGELPQLELTPPVPSADNFDLWEQAGAVAVRFWEALGEDARVSDGIRLMAVEHAGRCQAALASHQG